MLQSLPLPQSGATRPLSCEAISEGSDIGILDDIRDPSVDLALFNRSLSSECREWIDALPAGSFPTGRLLVPLDRVEEGICSLFPGDMPAHQGALEFLQDIHRLCERFARITHNEWVDIRLEKVTGNACWKFHRDHVPLRLLTTYKGPGTQIVPDAYAGEALEEQRAYNGPLLHLDRTHVAIFKGKEHGNGEGLVHRSPPIAGTGAFRFFLCLNTPSLASPEPFSSGDTAC